MTKFKALLFALWTICVAVVCNSSAYADVPVPVLTGHVIDQTATLSTEESARLEQALSAFENRKGSQLAVLIVPTTEPETIEQYSIKVARHGNLVVKELMMV